MLIISNTLKHACEGVVKRNVYRLLGERGVSLDAMDELIEGQRSVSGLAKQRDLLREIMRWRAEALLLRRSRCVYQVVHQDYGPFHRRYM